MEQNALVNDLEKVSGTYNHQERINEIQSFLYDLPDVSNTFVAGKKYETSVALAIKVFITYFSDFILQNYSKDDEETTIILSTNSVGRDVILVSAGSSFCYNSTITLYDELVQAVNLTKNILGLTPEYSSVIETLIKNVLLEGSPRDSLYGVIMHGLTSTVDSGILLIHRENSIVISVKSTSGQ